MLTNEEVAEPGGPEPGGPEPGGPEPGGPEPGQVDVRRVRPDQWAIYREVRLAALAEAPYAFSSTLERELAFAEEVWHRRLGSAVAATFLAWQGQEPAGTVAGKADDPDEDFAVPGAWQLVGMWVDPAVRGLGVADRLVEAVAQHASTAGGARSLVLWVTEMNDRARGFYQRMGFVPTGARQLVRPDEPDNWEMQLIRRLG
ncbi:MAG TPA: GNAT family N-acetyltransferase [Streptosporangiaceae bacterium]